MKIITYSLFGNKEDSGDFYKKISFFAMKIINNLEEIFNKYITDYMNYIEEDNKEDIRSRSEYLLEILMMGVYWNNYINKAITLKKFPGNILIKLAQLRDIEKIKSIIDINRGILETIFLEKESYENIEFSKDNYMKLINYLKAMGDYKEEVKRLEMWQNYFYKINNVDTENILKRACDFAKIFEEISKKELGIYTENVDSFLQHVYEKYRFREDLLLCSRKEVEYHLNMVGAQIMNRAYKEEFRKTKEKRLLLPACMRAQNEQNCRAIKTDEGYLCQNCTQTCNINKYHKLGKKYDFKVYIIPHESNISIDREFEYGEIGIIGVACVLNLISGGLKAKNLGFVPQCVFLDYCGCKSHWDKEGIITDINLEYLLSSFGLEKNTTLYHDFPQSQ